MLVHLYIRDLAIVAHADLHFEPGMTVITGESGAGKTILLEALNLVLGERRDAKVVRQDAEKAEICATFDVSKLPGALLWLAKLDLADNEQCLIRRIIYQNGRSKAYVNGTPITNAQLRILGDYLVQMHGQHQHQRLLNPQEQLGMLDAYGQQDQLLTEVRLAFDAFEKKSAQWHALQHSAHSDESALLAYQLDELNTLALAPEEVEALEAEHTLLAHAQSTIHDIDAILHHLSLNPKSNAHMALSHALRLIEPLCVKFPRLKNVLACLNHAEIQLNESVTELTDFYNTLDMNPERLHQVENRLSQIHQCARKHRVAPKALYAHFTTLQDKAQSMLEREQKLITCQAEIDLALKRYHEKAGILSQKRELIRTQLAEIITHSLQRLGMQHSHFQIIMTCDLNKIHPQGYEHVVFGIAQSGNAPAQPIAKIASGGELSRISLALQLALASHWPTPCLIFDEVDVGVSGKVGSIVGRALSELSQVVQVLCITHLPQVAAFGDHHIHVQKQAGENAARSEIRLLDEHARVEEVARLLSGLDITDEARAQANALLTQSH